MDYNLYADTLFGDKIPRFCPRNGFVMVQKEDFYEVPFLSDSYPLQSLLTEERKKAGSNPASIVQILQSGLPDTHK
jgi:hypothetical protein